MIRPLLRDKSQNDIACSTVGPQGYLPAGLPFPSSSYSVETGVAQF